MNISNVTLRLSLYLSLKAETNMCQLLKVCRNYAILKIITQAVGGHHTNIGFWVIFPQYFHSQKVYATLSYTVHSVRPSARLSVRLSFR